MGIKLIKKESAQPKGHWVVYLRGEEWCTRNTEKEAQAVVNSYDGEGECWYEFEADEAVHSASVNAYTFAEPSFDAATYGLEEISKNDSGEIDVVDGVDSNDSAQALAKKVTALHKKYPEKKYHIIAIGTDSDGVEDMSEVIWSDYPEEVSVDEGADGFSHTWELQAQQAKETLEEITKKFGDTDRLAFEIRNFPHDHECDVVVTVDGNPFITAEFEGGTHSGIRWHCFEDDTTDTRLDVGDENAAKDMILAFKDDILDALESLYGFGAIADEGGQRTEKTAWTYLVERETLEGAESRQEATEKILKALGYNPGTEGRWYDKNGEEINIIDTLDNTEWDFAVKTCGQLQESTEKQETTANPRWCVEFGDIYSNVQKEYYDSEADAKARYDELAERGDIEWVEDPVMEAAEEETVSYDDYAESVKSILMGREFEYGPETANQFVVDDYKDIVRKNFDAGKGAFTAAADIDDAYMGKE